MNLFSIAALALILIPVSLPGQDAYENNRNRMVDRQIAARGISDPATLAAMRSVQRHLFVPEQRVRQAYDDSPLPIGYGQTISQPYIVALMTELVFNRGPV